MGIQFSLEQYILICAEIQLTIHVINTRYVPNNLRLKYIIKTRFKSV